MSERQTKKEPLDTVLMGHALAVRETADTLFGLLGEEVGRDESEDLQTIALKAVGFTLSMVVLRALAAELMLKALAYRTTGTYRKGGGKGHDLRILFEDLDTNTKGIIGSIAQVHGVAPVDQILEKHRGDFTDWRYAAEANSPLNVNFLDLDKALTVLHAAHGHQDLGCHKR